MNSQQKSAMSRAASLSYEDVMQIRHDYWWEGRTQRDLAVEWNRSEDNIRRLVLGLSYKWVPLYTNPDRQPGRSEHVTRDSTRRRRRLDEDEVSRLRQLYALGIYTQAEVAEQFGISERTAGKLLREDGTDHYRRGEVHHKARLTPAQALQIRRAYNAEFATAPEMAAIYGVSESAIKAIVQGRSWQHLLEDEES